MRRERCSSERVVVVSTKEREFEEDCYVHVVVLTAGIALLMACLKRVLITVFLLEEWRAWVFVFINLVLLAILFTSSTHLSTQKETTTKDSGGGAETKITQTTPKTVSSDSEPPPVVVVFQPEDNNKSEDVCCDDQKKKINVVCERLLSLPVPPKENYDQTLEAPRLSKEELNERAEAFILMFRQHLVLDARKSFKR